MSHDAASLAGLLSISVWTEDGQFRARLRLTTDVARPHEGVTVVTSPEQVRTIVAAWLEMLAPAAEEAPSASGASET